MGRGEDEEQEAGGHCAGGGEDEEGERGSVGSQGQGKDFPSKRTHIPCII